MSTAASSFAHADEDQHQPLSPTENRNAWIAFWVVIAAATYGYFNMLMYTASYWSEDLYSHGWIVPLFAGYLLWVRRKPIERVSASERWIGVAVIVASLGVRLFGSYYDMDPLDRISFIGVLVGICQLVGGYAMTKWAGLAVAFVVFMFPLPAQLQYTVLTGLQKVAAVCSTVVLQILGVPALRDGSRIMIDQLPLEVADAMGFQGDVSLYPTTSLSARLEVRHERLTRQRDGSEYSSATIPRLETRYQFSRALFVRFIGEYASQRRAAQLDPVAGRSLYACEDGEACELQDGSEGHDFSVEGLVGYEPSPGTVFFLGYTRQMEDPHGFRFRDLRTQADGLFVKLSYRFRM